MVMLVETHKNPHKISVKPYGAAKAPRSGKCLSEKAGREAGPKDASVSGGAFARAIHPVSEPG